MLEVSVCHLYSVSEKRLKPKATNEQKTNPAVLIVDWDEILPGSLEIATSLYPNQKLYSLRIFFSFPTLLIIYLLTRSVPDSFFD